MGRSYSTPAHDSDIPRKESFPSNIPQYELIFFPSSNRILSYNGITKHITNSTIVFLPHCMTDIVNPPVKEYRCETFFDMGHIALQFTCDTPLSTQIETFCCEQFEKEVKVYFEKIRNLWELKPIGYNSQTMAYLYQILQRLRKELLPNICLKKNTLL